MARKQSTRDDEKEQMANAQPSVSTEESAQQRIAERAYHFYVERGAEDGHALEDWVRAEQEVLGEER